MAVTKGAAATKGAASRKPTARRAAAAKGAPKPARKVKRTRAVVAIIGRDEAARRAAAAGIARESGAALYRVDLARLINKYIGETEKAIESVLSRIESEDIVLFFDEADALFGARTDVRDAHDRYANQEISYLFGFRNATPLVEKFADVVIRARPRKPPKPKPAGRKSAKAKG
ncbi:MAG: AAA family ATPase [Alphaproteobacteria bacterium]|nr:AAA family ATPase [Alphaproteobacteria bacterium]